MGETHTLKIGARDSVTTRVVDEVAEREGVDPVDLTPPLYDVIDSDALEALLSDRISGGQRGGLNVTFTYCGYSIVVAEDGEIAIRPE